MVAFSALLLCGSASADPASVSVGGEAGAFFKIHWLGAASALDVPLTNQLSARLVGRWQHLDDESDECTFNIVGRQVDGSVGVRWDFEGRKPDRVVPFLAATAGIGYERTRNTCSAQRTVFQTHTTPLVVAGGGADVPVTRQLAVRAEMRVGYAHFRDGGTDDTVTNQELSIVLSLVANL